MDSFEWNKIAGAVLFALLLAVGLSIFSEIIFESAAPETPGYVVAVAAEGEAGGEAPASQPIGVLLAGADAGAGEAAAKKCLACHTFGEGEANKVGPNLWDVVMHPIAAHEGYEYSDAMKAYAEEVGDWSYEQLDTYLTDPTGVVPGTKMVFPGLKNDKERANVVAYLRSLSGSPEPLPEPQVASAEAEAGAGATAPAEEPAASEAEATTAAEAAEPDEAAAEEDAAPADEGEEEPAPEQETGQAEGAEEPAAAEERPEEEQQVAQADEGEEPAGEQAAAEIPAGDPATGEAFAKRCLACHTFNEGGPNKVGPHLFGVVGRPVASVPDYAYSDAMKAFSEGGAKTWDAAVLDVYLADPRGVVPGSKMIFPGVKAEADRANVIAYLATLN